ncbi:MAG: class Ib ribonucleoside-diphosphate reductase assembly flavoprotein NrdI [Micrococcaceae bacterium]
MTKLVYFSSVSNNTHRFVEKLGISSLRLPLYTREETPIMHEDFVLMLPTYGGGKEKATVPKQVIKFLNVPKNREHIKGVIGSGNTNFGADYCKAAKIVSYKCQVPVLFTYELMGTPEDVQKVQEGLKEFWRNQQLPSHQM